LFLSVLLWRAASDRLVRCLGGRLIIFSSRRESTLSAWGRPDRQGSLGYRTKRSRPGFELFGFCCVLTQSQELDGCIDGRLACVVPLRMREPSLRNRDRLHQCVSTAVPRLWRSRQARQRIRLVATGWTISAARAAPVPTWWIVSAQMIRGITGIATMIAWRECISFGTVWSWTAPLCIRLVSVDARRSPGRCNVLPWPSGERPAFRCPRDHNSAATGDRTRTARRSGVKELNRTQPPVPGDVAATLLVSRAASTPLYGRPNEGKLLADTIPPRTRTPTEVCWPRCDAHPIGSTLAVIGETGASKDHPGYVVTKRTRRPTRGSTPSVTIGAQLPRDSLAALRSSHDRPLSTGPHHNLELVTLEPACEDHLCTWRPRPYDPATSNTAPIYWQE